MPEFRSPIVLQKLEIKDVAFQKLGTAPSSPALAQFYYDTNTNTPMYWGGSAWVPMTGGTPSGAAGGDLSGTYPNPTIDAEKEQDRIGAFIATGTKTGLTVTYDDPGGGITMAVTDSPMLAGLSSGYHLARANHTGTQAGTTILFAATDKLLGRDSAAGGPGEEIGVDSTLAWSGSGTIGRAAISGDVTIGAGSNTAAIGAGVIVNADVNATAGIVVTKSAASATDRLFGRDTAAAGAGEEIAVGGGIEFTGTGGIQTSAFTGNVTKAAGGTALTIPAGTVTLAMQANLVANSIIGNNTGGSAVPLALTAAQVKTMLALVAADITNFDTQVRTNRLDQMAAPTAAVSMNGQKITSLANGTAPTDAINLSQLQAVTSGQARKDPVDAATQGVLPNTPVYNNAAGTLTSSTNVAFPTIDGVAPALNKRYLVDDQANPVQNGIYTLTTIGSGAIPWVLTRAIDADTAAELTNATTLVNGGTVSLGTTYTCGTVNTLGTDAVVWTVTGNAIVYTADNVTLALTGTTFSIAAGGVTATQLAASVAGAGLTGGAGTPLAVGITAGLTVAADAIGIDTAIVARKFTGVLTGGATSEVITHNFGTRRVTFELINSATPWDHQEVDVESTSTNTLTIRAAAALPAGFEYIVVG